MSRGVVRRDLLARICVEREMSVRYEASVHGQGWLTHAVPVPMSAIVKVGDEVSMH
jgi:hypothetical protein